jgi:hypothetical protein
VAHLAGSSNHLGLSFTVTSQQAAYDIGGQVRDGLGQPISNVTLTLGGGSVAQMQTDADGNYSFDNLSPGSTYSVSASKTGSVFAPPSAAVPNLNANQKTVDFTGTAIRTLTVASSNPANGVNITVSPTDNNSQGSGTTQFTRAYNNNSNVSLTAPGTAGGNNFQKWLKDGADFANNTVANVNVTLDADHTMTAVYVASTPTVTVAVAPTSVTEDGATNLVYTFTRSGVTSDPLTVNFSVGGTAGFGTDYTQTGAATFGAGSGTVTIGTGNSTATVTVDPTTDTSFESDETVIVTVTAGTGYDVGIPSIATGTITNDDSAPQPETLQFSAATYNQGEGAGTATITVTRIGGSSGAASVQFSNPAGGTATGGGSCTAGVDYITPSGTLNWTDGEVADKTFAVTLCSENIVETSETVNLALSNATGATLGSQTTATLTINDDDTDVSVAVSPSSVAEDGVPNLVYTFTRNGVTSGALTVNFSVGGTATFSSDYTQSGAATFAASSGTVTFGAGNSAATVTIDPAVDTTVEPDETVILTVTSGTGYNVGSPSGAIGTIINDDTDVTVAVSPLSVAEDGAPNLVYTFTRNGVTSGALTVNFSVGGTATFSSDYAQSGAATFAASSGTVTFGAGNSTATVTIDPAVDTTVEPDETAIVTVTSGTGYNVASPSGATGTIINDDVGVLRIDSVALPAGRTSGGQQIVLTGAFVDLSTVQVGGVTASWLYTNSAADTTKITVTTPAHDAGAVQIDLTPTSGTAYSKTNAFAYLPTIFTDNTLLVGQTTAKAQHIIELRQAVDAMRAVAGLSGAPWTDPALAAGSRIKAIHILELRTFLDDAATRLGYSTSPYTDPSLAAGYSIKRIHIEELRQRIRVIAG